MKPNYIKHKITNLFSISKIVSIHYYELSKNFSFDGESHDFWEAVYADAGEVIISTGDREHNLKQGEMIFHKPKEFHTLRADGKTPSNVFIISFVCSSQAMDFFKNKLTAVSKKAQKCILNIMEEYKETFKEMPIDALKLELCDNPKIGGQQMIRTYLEQLLITLIRTEENSNDTSFFPTKESMENHLVTNVIQLIEDTKYGRISVDSICKELNYSRTYLSKLFRSITGYTILEYMTKSKIKEAKKLLREDKYNITEISDMLCFDNPHYFSAVFKKVTNMTPSGYKNSIRTL